MMDFNLSRLSVFWLAILTALPVSLLLFHSTYAEAGSTVLNSHHKSTPLSVRYHSTAPLRSVSGIVSLVRIEGTKRKPASRRFASSRSMWRQNISAKNVVVMDGRTGKILYALNPDIPRQPASTIKVLTGLIALQFLNNSDMVLTSAKAASMPRSKIYLRKGKSYIADDLINAVLLSSANDASVALAEKIAGSERTFARLMTKRAYSIGARRTVCKNSTGLTANGQQSTVRDLAVVFAYAMQDKEFAARMAKIRVERQNGKTIRNHNRALWQVDGAKGGKTGFTRAARQTYVGKFRREENELVVAIMGSESMWDDIAKLVEYGFNKQKRMANRRDTGQYRVTVVDEARKALKPSEVFAGVRVLSDNKKVSRL